MSCGILKKICTVFIILKLKLNKLTGNMKIKPISLSKTEMFLEVPTGKVSEIDIFIYSYKHINQIAVFLERSLSTTRC